MPMAIQRNHEPAGLANRLTAAADQIVNSAANGLESDLREAARQIEGIPPRPLIPTLMSEIAKIASTCPDPNTARKLRQLLGEG